MGLFGGIIIMGIIALILLAIITLLLYIISLFCTETKEEKKEPCSFCIAEDLECHCFDKDFHIDENDTYWNP